MRVLITGIGGFVGPYLRNLLVGQGHEVFGFERRVLEGDRNVFCGDLLVPEDVENAVTKSQPDAVVHLAGFSSVKASFDQPELCHRVNVGGTENLLKACLKLGKKPRIVVVSSAEIYGKPQFTPITEEHPLNPKNPYAKSRLAQEELVMRYQRELPIVIMRSFNHTGPGQLPIFVVADFAKQIVEVERKVRAELVVGNLDAVRDFTDVRDVVRAYVMAIESEMAGEVYNICSGQGRSVHSILDDFVRLSGVKIDIRPDPDRIRPSDVPVLIGSNEKFNKVSGWKPEIRFEQTLKDMLDCLRADLN